MSDRIRVERDGAVAEVCLTRPDKHNGLDRAMFEALVSTARVLADDPTLRAVVLHGEGPSFCAGLDFASFVAEAMQGGPPLDALLSRDDSGSPANFAQQAAWGWAALPVPVIAALHGHVYGGGLQIALAADLRFCAPDARLSVREIEWGLIPDMTASQTLRHLVRLDVARELTYTGRVVSGQEAASLGLVTRVEADPLAAARTTARLVATKSPEAIRAAKRMLDETRTMGVAEGLALEERLQRTILGKPNQMEAVAARMAKREPVFRDPD